MANRLDLSGTSKLTNFFKPKEKDLSNSSKSKKCELQSNNKRRKIQSSCPGFSFGNNEELVNLYNKYKKLDNLNKQISIVFRDRKWSVHSVNCTGECVLNRKSQRKDKKACDACFNFDSIIAVRDRIKRMEKTLHIENYLTETRSSETGLLAVRDYLKSNTKTASPATISLIKRCKQYVVHHQWMKENYEKLKNYNAIDNDGKIHHQRWLNKFSQIYFKEPAMKNSLLTALMQFIVSRYDGNVNAPANTKLISFFQTMYALSPKMYNVFQQNFGGYNKRTLQRHEAQCSPETPIIDCSRIAIQTRAKMWIDNLRTNDKSQIMLVSAMADATKVPPLGEFSPRYHAWVGGTHPNHYINEFAYDEDQFIKTEMAAEIKVAMLTVQDCQDGLSPFKIIAARPQSTNELSDEYNTNILHSTDCLKNVYLVSIAFDGLATETNFI